MKNVIFAGLCFAFFCCKEAPRTAEIYFAKDTMNVNTSQGQIVGISYPFTNKGNDTLRIKSIDAGCGCTSVSSSKYTVPPGDTASINVKYDSSRDEGKALKIIVVETNTKPILHTLVIQSWVRKLIF